MKRKSKNKVNEIPNSLTHNLAPAYDHSKDHLLEYFSKAGSLFVNKESYYGNETSALDLFKNAWYTSKYEKCIKLLFWTRDIRNGGAGNRSATRAILNWLSFDNEGQKWIKANLELIPHYGRWDDLKALYNTPLEKDALKLWAKAIKEGHPLACKWADRQDKKFREFLKLSPKEFRKLLVKNTNVVETLMCKKQWNLIDYSKVPSIAIGRYNNAFNRNDSQRFNEWKNSLININKDGEIELNNRINAGAIYPHDLVRIIKNYDKEDISEETKKLIEAQFLSLPNFMENSNYKIMTIIDTSGSMYTKISGSIKAIDISISMGLYCSDRLGKDSPFYRKVIPFNSNAKFISWENLSFVDGYFALNDGYVGSTNIESALRLILDTALTFKVHPKNMINCLLILSDMQFDQAVSDFIDNKNKNSKITPIDKILTEWENKGYKRPKIIYWNLAGYKNQPCTKNDKDILIVSGFNPNLIKFILGTKDFNPITFMNTVLNTYKINIP